VFYFLACSFLPYFYHIVSVFVFIVLYCIVLYCIVLYCLCCTIKGNKDSYRLNYYESIVVKISHLSTHIYWQF